MTSPEWRIGSGDQATRIASGAVTEAAGPGWSGRFERMSFGPGFHIHLGHLDVAVESEVPVLGLSDGPPPISAFTLISGRAVLAMAGWPQLKLAPAEALAAVTVNAAHVLGCADDRGRIAAGERADIVVLDAPDWRYLAYHLAGDLVATVIKDGRVIDRALP